jgi:hypothetical protein
MAITAIDLPIVLIERIKNHHPAPAFFTLGETDDWPPDAVPALLRQGLLTEANRSDLITCPGCEMQCHKRVVVRLAGEQSRAFIMCDEDPRHGRISVTMRSLRRFETGLRALSHFIAAALNVGPPAISRNGSAYGLGEVKGQNGMRSLMVGFENNELVLGVGSYREPLGVYLSWSAAGLTVNAKAVQRLVDRKATKDDARAYTPDRTAQQERAKETRRRNAALYAEANKRSRSGGGKWTAIADSLVGTEFAGTLTGPTIRRIISRMRRAERKNRAQIKRSSSY